MGIYSVLDQAHLSRSPLRQVERYKRELAKVEAVIESIEKRLQNDPDAHLLISGTASTPSVLSEIKHAKDLPRLRGLFWRCVVLCTSQYATRTNATQFK